MVEVYIGLGSNLENPEYQVRTAIEELKETPRTSLIKASSLYQSRPMGPKDQPDFINAVVQLETELQPEQLLDELQALEVKHGRSHVRYWGERTLDLDILLYGVQAFKTERLQIPHPGILDREFVIVPLAEIAPQIKLRKNQRASELAKKYKEHIIRLS